MSVVKLSAARRVVLIGALLAWVQPAEADEIQPLIESSCIGCHDENTETRLDFTKLDRNFEDSDTFRVLMNYASLTEISRWITPISATKSRPNPDKTVPTASIGKQNTS